MELPDVGKCEWKDGNTIGILSKESAVMKLNLEIEPAATLRISGSVLDRYGGGKGVEDAYVAVYSADRRLLDSTHTDVRGHFSFEGIPPGFCLLSASKNGYYTAPFREILLEPGIPASLHMVLLPTDMKETLIYGKVTDFTGKPVPDAELCIQWESGQAESILHSDTAGEYALYAVPCGACTVTARKSGYGSWQRKAAVTEQLKLARADMVLPPDLSCSREAAVGGFVTNCEGKPVGGVLVELYPAGGKTPAASTHTTAGGYYSFSPVEPGKYFVKSKVVVN